MKTVFVERQDDDSFAVYLGGDDDTEGVHDRLYSWGVIDDRRITRNQAKLSATTYAKSLAKELGAEVQHIDN